MRLKSTEEKGRMVIIIILLIVTVLSITAIFFVQIYVSYKNKKQVSKENAISGLSIYKDISEEYFVDDDGNKVKIGDDDSVQVIVYWASWCPFCVTGLADIKGYAEAIEEAGAELVLVDKLDGEKETKERAKAHLEKEQIEQQTLYDENCISYDKIGLNMIPTIIVVDNDGIITSFTEGITPEKNEILSMIEEAKVGKAQYLMSFIERNMTNDEGGIRTNYGKETENIPSGEDVLSESMGIMLEYAANIENKALFDKYYSYVKKNQFQEGLMPWVISDRTVTNVNAGIDDFRIVNALIMAESIWGGYIQKIDAYSQVLLELMTENSYIVDCYDFENQCKSEQMTLCYADFETMSKLGEINKDWNKINQNCYHIVEEGFISADFPFYKKAFDFSKKRYDGNIYNMSETLTTLLHLAEVKEVSDASLDWIDQHIRESAIYGIYDESGNPVEGGRYESTAVYSLAAMIALKSGREDLARAAITRTEPFKIRDYQNQLDGGFGNLTGEGIYSFDQGMALLSYGMFEEELQ